MGRTLLVTVGFIAASIWIGSIVCLAVVAAEARHSLDAADQVALFRGIGRRYAFIGTGSLLVALVAGVAIAGAPSEWSPLTTAALTATVGLLLLTGVGMAQARRMTVLRGRVAAAPNDAEAARDLKRGAAAAGLLRGLMAVVTAGIVTLIAHQLAA